MTLTSTSAPLGPLISKLWNQMLIDLLTGQIKISCSSVPIPSSSLEHHAATSARPPAGKPSVTVLSPTPQWRRQGPSGLVTLEKPVTSTLLESLRRPHSVRM